MDGFNVTAEDQALAERYIVEERQKILEEAERRWRQFLNGVYVGGKLQASKLSGTAPASTIPDTTVTPGTYGGATAIPQFTVESDGRLTFAQNVAISAGGSVSSVGLSMPAEFNVANSPVTSSGTITVTKATESANTVYAGPTSGGAAAPTFRALVAADIPSSVGLGTHVYIASQNGCALNTSLTTGGGTDDTSAIQTILNHASGGTPILLIMDGPARISGVNVYGNTTIYCLEGAGFYLANSSNRPMVRNANPSASVVTDQNIALIGGVYNGNNTNQSGTPAGSEHDAFVQGVGFYGVTNLFLDHVTISNARQYAAAFSLCTNVVIRDCEVQNGTAAGRDGFHFFGGCTKIRGWGCKGQTGSDFFAFNSTDYIGVTATWVKTLGDITDVIVGDTYLQAAANGVGLLSAEDNLDNIFVRGLHGSVREYALSLWNDFDTSHQGGHLKRVTIQNITAYASGATPVGAHPCIVFAGNGDSTGAVYIENLQISDVQWDNSVNTNPWLYVDAHTTIDVLHIQGFVVNERTARSTPGAIIENHGVIGLLVIDGLVWNRPGESAAGYVVNNAGTITTLEINQPQTTNLNGPVTNTGTITNQYLDLVPSGVTAGTYGDDTHVAAVTVANTGRVTGIASTAITFPSTVGEQLVEDGASAPPVTLTNEAEDDWLYADT